MQNQSQYEKLSKVTLFYIRLFILGQLTEGQFRALTESKI